VSLSRYFNNRNTLGLLFMLPAAALLLVFLTYPLGLGTWLGFTDAKIGRSGEWVGLENFIYLFGDSVARLSLFNTLFYTIVASVIKFALGLWLALLLNKHLPFKAFLRAIVLLPFIVRVYVGIDIGEQKIGLWKLLHMVHDFWLARHNDYRHRWLL